MNNTAAHQSDPAKTQVAEFAVISPRLRAARWKLADTLATSPKDLAGLLLLVAEGNTEDNQRYIRHLGVDAIRQVCEDDGSSLLRLVIEGDQLAQWLWDNKDAEIRLTLTAEATRP